MAEGSSCGRANSGRHLIIRLPAEQMLVAKMLLGAASPFANEKVIEPTANRAAGQGDGSGGPFFSGFGTDPNCNALHHPGNEALDNFFLDEIPSQIYASGGGSGDPQLGGLSGRDVFKSVD